MVCHEEEDTGHDEYAEEKTDGCAGAVFECAREGYVLVVADE